MVWFFVAFPVVIVTILIMIATRSMNISREPDREGIQDKEASVAYDRTSRWPVFAVERYLVLKAIVKYSPIGLVVDIGCGPGFLAARIKQRYPQLKVVGLDSSNVMLSLARNNWPSNRYDLEFVAGDAHRLPFAKSSIDTVVSSLSLHHWLDARSVFEQIQSILKPGGRFLFFDLRRDSPRIFYYALILAQIFSPTAIRRTNGEVGSFWSSYTPVEIETLISASGLEIEKIEVNLGWMLICGRKGKVHLL